MGDSLIEQMPHSVFSGREWREVADALFELTGAAITVSVPADGGALYASARCAYCELLHPSDGLGSAGGWGCLGRVDEFHEGRTTCFSGLPCHVGRVEHEGSTVAFITVSGFVSATRERKLLFERLVAAGVGEDRACQAVRDIPVLPRRRAEASLRALCSHAESVFARASESHGSRTRLNELETFLDAGREFLELGSGGDGLEERVLARALLVVGADSGVLTLRRPGTDLLEVAACLGMGEERSPGDLLRLDDALEGRVVASGSSVIMTGHAGDGPQTTTLCVGLRRAGGCRGAITVHGVRARGQASSEAMRLLERFAAVAAAVLENTRADRAAHRALGEMVHLSQFAKSLAACSTCDEVSRVAASVVEKMLDVRLSGVVLTAWGRDSVDLRVCGGVARSDLDAALCDAAGRDVHSEPFETVRTTCVTGEIVETDSEADALSGPVLSVPLTVSGMVAGYVFAALPGEGRFSSADERVITEAASHVSAALARAVEWERLREDQNETIAALSAALDSAERVEHGHADRIAHYALGLGREMALSAEDMRALRFAAVVHDIGTLGIDPAILGKPGPLSAEEIEEMRRHPAIGAEILEQLQLIESVAPAVKHHHERWDGGGYPGGLGGTKIPLLARVLAVVDAFDAMTSPRAYRRQLSVVEARRELEQGAGSQFDPQAVEAFTALLDREARAGMTGLLATEVKERGSRLPA